MTRARSGDRSAFDELWRRYAPVVHGVLLSMVRYQEALDLVQDVGLSALRSITRLEDPRAFTGWLMQIARNRAKDALRRRRYVEEIPEQIAAPDPIADEDRRADEVLAAIRSLPDAYRVPLVLRLVEGMSGTEIAERTGLTPGSVRVNLCRGMKRLRRIIGEEDAP